MKNRFLAALMLALTLGGIGAHAQTKIGDHTRAMVVGPNDLLALERAGDGKTYSVRVGTLVPSLPVPDAPLLAGSGGTLQPAQAVTISLLPVGTSAGQIASATDPRLVGALQQSELNQPNGVPQLNGSSLMNLGTLGGTTATTPLGKPAGTVFAAAGVLAVVPDWTAMQTTPVTTPQNMPWNNGNAVAVPVGSVAYPTSPNGLHPGDVWSDGGMLVVVPGASLLPTTPGATGTLWNNGGIISIAR